MGLEVSREIMECWDDMNPVMANLGKLRNLVNNEWRIQSVNMQAISSYAWRTTVLLKRGKQDIALQSEDQDFFQFCVALRQFLNESGSPLFRRVADLSRYYDEVAQLSVDTETKRKEAVQRCFSGKLRLKFDPERMIAEFLTSRKWGDSRYLPLKAEYFNVLAALLFSSKQAVEAQARVQKKFPASIAYTNRIGNLLLRAFEPLGDPVKSYLRFADTNKYQFCEAATKLLDEIRFNEDTFAMLAKKETVDGRFGMRYLIDMYRRYIERASPLLKVLSDLVCELDGKPAPELGLGVTKRVDLIRQSSYSDIVDCVDPRIRHAASHNGISFDHDQCMVKFVGTDADGIRKFHDFELSYAQASDMIRVFTQGFIPGMFVAFGMQQQLQLLSAVASEEYLNLLLIIDNEAVE